jgi:hypothetical protein
MFRGADGHTLLGMTRRLAKSGPWIVVAGILAAIGYAVLTAATGGTSSRWPVWPYFLCVALIAAGGILYVVCQELGAPGASPAVSHAVPAPPPDPRPPSPPAPPPDDSPAPVPDQAPHVFMLGPLRPLLQEGKALQAGLGTDRGAMALPAPDMPGRVEDWERRVGDVLESRPDLLAQFQALPPAKFILQSAAADLRDQVTARIAVLEAIMQGLTGEVARQ